MSDNIVTQVFRGIFGFLSKENEEGLRRRLEQQTIELVRLKMIILNHDAQMVRRQRQIQQLQQAHQQESASSHQQHRKQIAVFTFRNLLMSQCVAQLNEKIELQRAARHQEQNRLHALLQENQDLKEERARLLIKSQEFKQKYDEAHKARMHSIYQVISLKKSIKDKEQLIKSEARQRELLLNDFQIERQDKDSHINSLQAHIQRFIFQDQNRKNLQERQSWRHSLFRNNIFHPRNEWEILVNRIELLTHKKIERTVVIDYICQSKSYVEADFSDDKNYVVVMKTLSNVCAAAVKCVINEFGQRKIKNLMINLTTQRAFEVIGESQNNASHFHHLRQSFVFGNGDLKIQDNTMTAYSNIGQPNSNFDLDGGSSEDLFSCPLPANLQCFEIFEIFFNENE